MVTDLAAWDALAVLANRAVTGTPVALPGATVFVGLAIAVVVDAIAAAVEAAVPTGWSVHDRAGGNAIFAGADEERVALTFGNFAECDGWCIAGLAHNKLVDVAVAVVVLAVAHFLPRRVGNALLLFAVCAGRHLAEAGANAAANGAFVRFAITVVVLGVADVLGGHLVVQALPPLPGVAELAAGATNANTFGSFRARVAAANELLIDTAVAVVVLVVAELVLGENFTHAFGPGQAAIDTGTHAALALANTCGTLRPVVAGLLGTGNAHAGRAVCENVRDAIAVVIDTVADFFGGDYLAFAEAPASTTVSAGAESRLAGANAKGAVGTFVAVLNIFDIADAFGAVDEFINEFVAVVVDAVADFFSGLFGNSITGDTAFGAALEHANSLASTDTRGAFQTDFEPFVGRAVAVVIDAVAMLLLGGFARGGTADLAVVAADTRALADTCTNANTAVGFKVEVFVDAAIAVIVEVVAQLVHGFAWVNITNGATGVIWVADVDTAPGTCPNADVALLAKREGLIDFVVAVVVGVVAELFRRDDLVCALGVVPRAAAVYAPLLTGPTDANTRGSLGTQVAGLQCFWFADALASLQVVDGTVAVVIEAIADLDAGAHERITDTRLPVLAGGDGVGTDALAADLFGAIEIFVDVAVAVVVDAIALLGAFDLERAAGIALLRICTNEYAIVRASSLTASGLGVIEVLVDHAVAIVIATVARVVEFALGFTRNAFGVFSADGHDGRVTHALSAL